MNQVAKTQTREIASTAETQTGVLSVIERVALDPNIDITKMQALLDMQERIMAKQSEDAFNDVLRRAQDRIAQNPVIRNKSNTETKSTYADLQAVNNVAMPILTTEGINLSFDTQDSPHENHIRVAYAMSAHGHTRRGHIDMPLDLTGPKGSVNKTRLHGIKSAITYAQRTLVCLLCNIATTDDDGNSAGAKECVSDKQAADIQAFAEEIGANIPSMLAWQKVESISDIPANRYADVMAMLEKRRKAGAKS